VFNAKSKLILNKRLVNVSNASRVKYITNRKNHVNVQKISFGTVINAFNVIFRYISIQFKENVSLVLRMKYTIYKDKSVQNAHHKNPILHKIHVMNVHRTLIMIKKVNNVLVAEAIKSITR
jgi:hypothetical protein